MCDLLDTRSVREITGWDVGESSRGAEVERGELQICHWETRDVTGLIQLQLQRGAGQEGVQARRELLQAFHGWSEPADLVLVDERPAFEHLDHGVAGAVIEEHFVQVTVFGDRPGDELHRVVMNGVVEGAGLGTETQASANESSRGVNRPLLVGAEPLIVPEPGRHGVPIFIGSGSRASGPYDNLWSEGDDPVTTVPGMGQALASSLETYRAMSGKDAYVWTLTNSDPTNLVKALQSLDEPTIFDLIVVPEVGDLSGDDYFAVVEAMIKAAESIGGMALIDLPTSAVNDVVDGTSTIDDLVEVVDRIAASTPSPRNAAVYLSPVVDGAGGVTPTAVAVAAIASSVDAYQGPWNAPAGVSHQLPGRPLLASDDESSDAATKVGLNPLREIPGYGTIVWGARTLASSGPDRYIPNVRNLLTIDKTIHDFVTAFSDSSNDESTWNDVRSGVSAFLQSWFAVGGLGGASASEAFQVKVGLGQTMTATDIESGTLRLDVVVNLGGSAGYVDQTFEVVMTPTSS